jgi:MFS family permease
VTSPARRGRSLLRRNRQLRILLTARVVSFAGDQLTAVALTLHVHGRYGAGTAVSVLLTAQVLPHLAGAWAGTIVDRTDQRTVLRACEAVRAVVVLTIAVLLPPLAILVALVAVNAVLATVLRPAGRSAIPALVGPDELGAANGALATGANVGLALGPLLGGALTAWLGVRLTLLVDVLTSLAAALGLRRLQPLPPEQTDDLPTRFRSDVAAGLRLAWQHPTARLLAVTLLVAVALAGSVLVAGVFLIRDELAAGPAGYGAFTGAWGIGMIAASLAIAGCVRPGSPRRWLTVALGAQALALLAAGGSPIVAAAIVAAVLGGVGNGLQDIATDTLLQQAVPRRFLGRAVGAVYSASFAGELVAYGTAGILVDLAGARTVLVGAGGGLLALTVIVAANLALKLAKCRGGRT